MSATNLLADGMPLEILHHGEKVQLSAGEPKVRPIQATKRFFGLPGDADLRVLLL